MSRGVDAVSRSPLSEEVKAELARAPLAAWDRRVLAALLPRAAHLGLPERRVAHSSGAAPAHAYLRQACCRRTYLPGLCLAGRWLSAGRSGYLRGLRPPRGEVVRARPARARGPGATAADPAAAPRSDLREAQVIASFLRATGASETALRFESRRVARELRGRTNALVNADAANPARAVRSAREQLIALRELARRGRLRALPAPGRAAAHPRVVAPTAALVDLACGPRTTKGAVRGRLRRVREEAGR